MSAARRAEDSLPGCLGRQAASLPSRSAVLRQAGSLSAKTGKLPIFHYEILR
jgi:hypothetical protein